MKGQEKKEEIDYTRPAVRRKNGDDQLELEWEALPGKELSGLGSRVHSYQDIRS